MRPSIRVVTLAVADLERSLAFYRDGLGLASSGIVATEYHDDVSGAAGAIATFELDDGLFLSLYPRTDLAKDAGIALDATSRTEFSLGHLVDSREEVDAVLARARAAGARLTGGPRERPWGIYSAYFEDPDGHLWEVIWNPEHGRRRGHVGSRPKQPSEQDDRVAAWVLAVVQPHEGGGPIDREAGADQRVGNAQRLAVRARVQQEQDDPIDPSVTLLQGKPPRQLLEVARTRLRLHPDPDRTHRDNGIPGPLITRQVERDLVEPSRVGRKPGPQPPEEGGLGGASERRAARVRADGEIESDGCEQPEEVPNADLGSEGVLDATHLSR